MAKWKEDQPEVLKLCEDHKKLAEETIRVLEKVAEGDALYRWELEIAVQGFDIVGGLVSQELEDRRRLVRG